MRIIASMKHYLEDFLAYMNIEQGASPHTLEAYRRDITHYLDWIAVQGKAGLEDVERKCLIDYITSLKMGSAEKDAQPLSANSIERRLSAINSFYKYLAREGFSLKSPSSQLTRRQKVQHLPNYLSVAQVDALFKVLDPELSASQLRRRAFK